MLPAPAVPQEEACAFFLDVDGTLLDIADAPDRVHVAPRVLSLLRALAEAAGGALALVSGRSLADLDSLFTPLRLPAAGLHGAERRDVSGIVHHHSVDGRLDRARRELAAWSAGRPGTLVEDKGAALALHYRLAPDAEADARELMRLECGRLGGDYVLQEGKCVLELKPSGVSKATAIAAFRHEPPFAGRRPVFLGDDVTDEDGFAAVREAGGIAIAVGERPGTRAQYGLADVPAVLDYLAACATAGRGSRP